ncbi:subtilisin-like protease SBT3 [Nymphaea colorata]|nr:subtilisin-like protease SBT3 [Nymphaea colorata]
MPTTMRIPMASLAFFMVMETLLVSVVHSVSISSGTDAYIVHMDAAAMPKVFTGTHHWHEAILASESLVEPQMASAGSRLLYSYNQVVNGFSASLSKAQLEQIRKSPGFLSAYQDKVLTIDTTHTFEFLGLNAESGMWPNSDYGEGIIIGVIDTGIWPESRSFGDDGMSDVPTRWKGECQDNPDFSASMCNRKLIGARFFNRGLLAQYPSLSDTIINSTRDYDGHGTHTSSIAAGNCVMNASYFGYASGRACGVAPRARLAAYKVFWDGIGFSSDLLAAFDQAISDGVDIISVSMSLRSASLYEDPIAIASFTAMEKGIFVSASAGNQGPMSKSVRNVAPWLLTVGATNIDRKFLATAILGNGVEVLAESLYFGNASLNSLPLHHSSDSEACNSVEVLNNIGYKVVICKCLSEAINTQLFVISNSKVAGALFLTSYPVQLLTNRYVTPAAILNPNDSSLVHDYVSSSDSPIVSLRFGKTVTGTKPAPSVASYSSRGPSPTTPMILKPDLVAPGTLVLASWPMNSSVVTVHEQPLFSEFNLMSGTSMACPHASGVAALLKATHPDWSGAAIRSAMMTTADVLDNTESPIASIIRDAQPATPLDMGSGQLSPNKAMDPGLVYDISPQDYVKFLCGLNYTKEQMQTITGKSLNNDTCSEANLDLNYPSFIATFKFSEPSHMKKFSRTLTNVGDGNATYTAKLTSLDGFKVTVIPQTLVFKEKKSKASFTLSIEVRNPKFSMGLAVSSLSWVDDRGKYKVTNPIVVMLLA